MTFTSGKFTNFYFNTADWFTLMEENSGISLCKNPVLGGAGGFKCSLVLKVGDVAHCGAQHCCWNGAENQINFRFNIFLP